VGLFVVASTRVLGEKANVTSAFAGKRIWITGASSGIGEAYARAFAKAGANLILSARRESELERARLTCERPDDHLSIALDVTDAQSIAAAFARVTELDVHPDILVNNSGISQRALAVDTPLEVDRRIMEVNYFGTLAMTKAALPRMIARRSGQIVVTSSVMGHLATPFRSAYAASKHALHGFFDCLRSEVAPYDIAVTLICPGFVQTEISKNALTKDGTPLNKMAKVQAEGMTPDFAAQHALRAIEKRQATAFIGGREVIAAYARRFAPAWVDRKLARMQTT
jgi:short-subunit dehydrogenase